MNEVEALQQEVKTFAGTIPSTITNQAELTEGESLFVAIRKKRKEVEKYFAEKFIDPAKKLLKGYQDEAKLAIQPLVDAEAVLTSATSKFRQVERERLAKEQAKLNAQYEKKVEKAIAKGKDIEAVPPPVVVQQQAKTTETGDGKLSYRLVKKLVEVDANLTPDAFVIITRTPNKKMIDSALRAGQTVAGWRLDEVEELAVR